MERLSTIGGHAGFYYKNLVSGEALQYNADDLFLAASIIKLPMAVVMELMFARGSLDPMSVVTITDGEKVGGAGGLSLIPGDVHVNIRGLYNNMIALSDNTATNKLLRTVSLKSFEDGFNSIGLSKTRINRLLYDKEAQKKGINNYFVLSEIMVLLDDLYQGNKFGKDVSDAVLAILKQQQFNHKIPCRIPGKTEIAHKTGEDEGTTHDVGIVYAEKPFLIGFASNNVDVYEMEDAIKNISWHLYSRNSMKQA